MSFYTALSGLKAAQNDLSVISNNVANVNSTSFKKSRAVFGDIFSAAPMQTTSQVAGQGTRISGVQQQFTQGTVMRSAFQFLSMRQSMGGAQETPPSNSTKVRSGNLAKTPSVTRLTKWAI